MQAPERVQRPSLYEVHPGFWGHTGTGVGQLPVAVNDYAKLTIHQYKELTQVLIYT